MGFPKVGTRAANKGGIMQIGSLYSCKWTPWHCNEQRGWDLLMLIRIDYVDDIAGRYVFYDLIHGAKRVLSRGLTVHCKEITKEESCK